MVLLFFQFKLKMAVHTARTKKKICEVNNFWYSFKTSLFHFDVFSRTVSFPFKFEKSEESKNFPCREMIRPHVDTDFSKLVHLCLVKIFSLISTSEASQKTCENFSESYFYSLFNCEKALRKTSALQIQRIKNIHSVSTKSQTQIFWNWKQLVLYNLSDNINSYLDPWTLIFINLTAWQYRI